MEKNIYDDDDDVFGVIFAAVVSNERRKKEAEKIECVKRVRKREREKSILRIYIANLAPSSPSTRDGVSQKSCKTRAISSRTKYKIDDSAFSVQQQAIDAMKMIMSPTVTSSI